MNYKKLIVEIVDKASEEQLRHLYHFIRAYLGLR